MKRIPVLMLILFGFIISSCAPKRVELPPKPPRYVYDEETINPPSKNSLWLDRASLYEDNKARRLNDLITIRIVENISGTGDAETGAEKESDIDAGLTGFFGFPLDMNMTNLFGHGHAFNPSVASGYKSSFKGSGQTKRTSKLIGTITAKVVEVMPNGNLRIEGRKEIMINNEKQILILMGMVRPEDIDSDNTVLSSRITDTEIYYVGKGIIQSTQDNGWFSDMMNKFWPF